MGRVEGMVVNATRWFLRAPEPGGRGAFAGAAGAEAPAEARGAHTRREVYAPRENAPERVGVAMASARPTVQGLCEKDVTHHGYEIRMSHHPPICRTLCRAARRGSSDTRSVDEIVRLFERTSGQLSDLRFEGTTPLPAHNSGADGWTMASASVPASASIASRRARCFGADASVLSTSSSSRAPEWSNARGRAGVASRARRGASCWTGDRATPRAAGARVTPLHPALRPFQSVRSVRRRA